MLRLDEQFEVSPNHLCAAEQLTAAQVVRTWNFHRAICEESGNAFLLQSWDNVSHLIRLYHRMSVGQTSDGAEVVRNNKAFMRSLREGEPADAEELLRSQIIRMAYKLLDRPIPSGVAGYVTRYVDEGGRIRAYTPPVY